MLPLVRLYWVDAAISGRLAVAPMPKGGGFLEEEIGVWKGAGVDSVLCLLTDTEMSGLQLAQEGELCQAQGMDFVHFPIVDRAVPDASAIRPLIDDMATRLRQGRRLLVHCRAGIGRTGLVASCCLIRCGFTATDAMAAVSRARGVAIPDTDEQRRWIEQFGERR
jgi:protein-tyrosine phosphatase